MVETESPSLMKRLTSRAFMLMNLLLVGAILWRLPAVIEGWSSGDEREGPADDTGQEEPRKRTRNPATHMPLLGMAEFQGDAKDACLRMEGFLKDMDYELAKADLNSRVPIQDAMNAIKAGQCSVDTPEIATAIAGLNTARVAVGLPHLPPKAQAIAPSGSGPP
jgi:hypothetical protein